MKFGIILSMTYSSVDIYCTQRISNDVLFIAFIQSCSAMLLSRTYSIIIIIVTDIWSYPLLVLFIQFCYCFNRYLFPSLKTVIV